MDVLSQISHAAALFSHNSMYRYVGTHKDRVNHSPKMKVPLVDEVARHFDHGKGSIGRAPIAPLGTLLLESRFIIPGNRGNKHMQVRLGLW